MLKNYDYAVISLLNVAEIIAPNQDISNAFSRMVIDMRRDGESASDIAVQVVLALGDGLRHGNWIGGK